MKQIAEGIKKISDGLKQYRRRCKNVLHLKSVIKFIIIAFSIICFIGFYGCTHIKNSINGHNTINDYKKMYEQLLKEQPPKIEKIRFETLDGKVLEENDNWIILQNKVRILVTLSDYSIDENSVVELYVAPTGTETFKLQQPIEYIVSQNGVAECIWEVPKGTMGHFWVVAYNKNVGRKSECLNVIRED